jgi:hypothetical protein
MRNDNDFITLTESGMLALWKQVMHLEPVVPGCSIERGDGIDLDAWLLTHIQQWYANLLATAPIEWVPVENVMADVVLTADDQGVVTAMVPPQCVRPVEWRLAGWRHSVSRFISADDPRAAIQHNALTRGGACNPAIVDAGDHLLLFSAMPGVAPVLERALCVVRPADGTYRLHRAALATIPTWHSTIAQL